MINAKILRLFSVYRRKRCSYGCGILLQTALTTFFFILFLEDKSQKKAMAKRIAIYCPKRSNI